MAIEVQREVELMIGHVVGNGRQREQRVAVGLQPAGNLAVNERDNGCLQKR